MLIPRVIACGECEACRRGRLTVCSTRTERPRRPIEREVLPARFLPLTGLQDRLVERELPVAPGTVYLDALWHVRHDRSAAHQWLLARFDEIAQAAAPA